MIDVREGSSLYYSLLWISEDQRLRFVNRLALVNALAETLESVQEPNVAEQKIHWWHEELERLNKAKARHPATQCCQTELQNNQSAIETCMQLLSAVASERFTPCKTDEEVDDLIIRGFQARLALLSHSLSQKQSDLISDNQPQLAALGFGLHERLRRLSRSIHRGQPVFSTQTFQRFNCTPQQLASQIPATQQSGEMPSTSSDAFKKIPILDASSLDASEHHAPLLAYAIDQVQTTLQRATQDESVQQHYQRRPLLPLWRLLILKHRQAKLWQKRQPNLLQEGLTLTPLLKLYHAWRHRH